MTRSIDEYLAAERHGNAQARSRPEPNVAIDERRTGVDLGEGERHEEWDRVARADRRQLKRRRETPRLDAEVVVANVDRESVRKPPPRASAKAPSALGGVVPCPERRCPRALHLEQRASSCAARGCAAGRAADQPRVGDGSSYWDEQRGCAARRIGSRLSWTHE